jgi:hypothetical protein
MMLDDFSSSSCIAASRRHAVHPRLDQRNLQFLRQDQWAGVLPVQVNKPVEDEDTGASGPVDPPSQGSAGLNYTVLAATATASNMLAMLPLGAGRDLRST